MKQPLQIIAYDLLIFLLIAGGQKSFNPAKWEILAYDTFAAYMLFGLVFILITSFKNEIKTY